MDTVTAGKSKQPPKTTPPDPLAGIPGVGERYADHLHRLGLEIPADLLRHYPHRWVDRREITSLQDLPRILALPPPRDLDGKPQKPRVTVLGRVLRAEEEGKRTPTPTRSRWRGKTVPQRLRVELEDASGTGQLLFFGAWRPSQFPTGAFVLATGPVSEYRGIVQIQNPDFEILNAEEESGVHFGKLLPVYPLTQGLFQSQIRRWVRWVFDHVLPGLPDPLPPELRARYRLADLAPALRDFHFPDSPEMRDQARRRLAFEEVFMDQLLVQAVRRRRELGKVGIPFPSDGPHLRRVRAALPFDLTPDQTRALAEILADLGNARPMNRLLQGDVGSGKTVVALLAGAAAADAGAQVAFMVPTEILAEQHHRTLGDLAGDLGLGPRLLTGSTSGAARREVLRDLASGFTPLVVGTHALFQDDVRFQNLGLVIVDEQHRFGVLQRLALLAKGRAPHVLVMSATPIPRSLALVQYADLDLSVLRERPGGRGRTTTRVVPEGRREEVYAHVAGELEAGRQAFVIYPLVEDSDKIELKAATTMAKELAQRPEFQKFPVGLLHGQMPAEEKEAVMARFVRGDVRLLVATTVVEVGIDVPNASCLLVEHPERYGLSQLHQLRGRVGRGPHASVCVLFRGRGVSREAAARLERFAKTDDGFVLAELDLELRGRGDFAGTRQHGRPEWKLADPARDVRMIEVARDEATALLAGGLATEGTAWEPLRQALGRLLEAMGDLVEAG